MNSYCFLNDLEISVLVMEAQCVSYEVVLNLYLLLKLISDFKISSIFYFCSFLTSKSVILRTNGCISSEYSLLASARILAATGTNDRRKKVITACVLEYIY